MCSIYYENQFLTLTKFWHLAKLGPVFFLTISTLTTMSHQHMLERTRPFTRTSSVDGLPTGVDSPHMSPSDSPGFSAAEESDFSGFASSRGGVPIRHTGFAMSDHLEYLQVCISSSRSSLHATYILTGNSIHEFLDKFPRDICAWKILKSMLWIPC